MFGNRHTFKLFALFIVAVCLFAPAATALAQESLIQLTPSEQAWLKAHPAITLGYVPDWSPISMRSKTGELDGIAGSYKKAIEKRLPIKFELVPESPWGAMLDGVRDKKIDVLLPLGRTAERDKYMLFTNVLAEAPYVIVTRTDSPQVNGLADLAGRHVSVRSRFVSHEWLAKEHPEIELLPRATTIEALEAVLFGEADAFVGSLPDAGNIISAYGLTNLKVAADASFSNRLSIGVRNDWPELATILDKAIADVSPDERRAIWNQWVRGAPEGFDKRIFYGLAAGFTLAIFAVLFIHIVRLRRAYELVDERVKERTRELEKLSDEMVFHNAIFYSMVEGVHLVRASDGVIVYANKKCEEMFGYGEGELVDRPVSVINASDERDPERVADEIIGELKKKGSWSGEVKNIRKDGTTFWSMAHVSTLSHATYGEVWVSVHSDITERKAVEERLRRSEEMFSSLARVAPVGIFRTDKEGGSVYINARGLEILGISASATKGQGWARAIHPDDRERVFEAWRCAVRDALPFKLEYRFQKPDGTVVWVLGQAEVERDATGQIVGHVGTIADFTEHNAAEEKLRQSEERYRLLIKASPFCIHEIGLDGLMLSMNEAGLTMLCLREEKEVVGVPYLSAVGERDNVRVAELMRDAFKGKTSHFEFDSSGDAPLRFKSCFVPIFDRRGKVTRLMGITEDITERKAAEEKLQKSETRFRETLDNMLEGCMILGYDWTYLYLNETSAHHGQSTRANLIGRTLTGMYPGVEKSAVFARYKRCMEERIPQHFEESYSFADGTTTWYEFSVEPVLEGIFVLSLDITKRKAAEEALGSIKWLLKEESGGDDVLSKSKEYEPDYGDLTKLNTEGEILRSIDKDILYNIANSYLGLLGTSSAIYEKNGDYAVGLFSSSWCRLMDKASREKCGTGDNRVALAQGNWLCHESCWSEASKVSIRDAKPVDIECQGGIHLYAVPIMAGGKSIGSINFGYGNPPSDPNELKKIAEKYSVDLEELKTSAKEYKTRPPFIIQLAKQRLLDSALLIGILVERKRAEGDVEKSREDFMKIVEGSPEPMAVTDEEQRIVFLNGKFTQVFGYTLSDIPTVEDWWPRAYPDQSYREEVKTEWNSRIERVMREGVDFSQMETVVVCKDGSKREIVFNFSFVGNRGLTIFHDITERKAAEEKLKAAKEEAEAATHLKDKFVSLVSHDLKVPLASMLGFIQFARGSEAVQSSDSVKLMLDKAVDSGRQMVTLVEDVLKISRFKSGHLKLEKQFFDARYVGAMAASNYAHLARQKGIVIENAIPENSRVYADKTLLVEAVQNLVTNSIKFCKSGDAITISLVEGDASIIYVRDTGAGIDPSRLEQIFDYDKKTSTAGTNGEVGTGFGLPIVKDIVELHGGELGVKTEPGKGCEFYLKLPVVRPTILLVDDSQAMRLLQKQWLTVLNVEFIEAGNGEEALKLVEDHRPHLVVTDVKMPVMDGLELLKRLKDNANTKDIPVIMISGEYGMEIRDKIFKLGADDFVSKNMTDSTDFLPRVRRFVG